MRDAARAPLAERVREAIRATEDTLQVVFSDVNYALLRAKLMAEMVIGVIAATELLSRPARPDAHRLRPRLRALPHARRGERPLLRLD
jgi:hypothetical protein